MKIYLSSLTLPIINELEKMELKNKPNALLSYGVDSSDMYLISERHRDRVDSLILDSGTFSIFNTKDGKNFSTEDYIKFLEYWNNKFDFYFNFDKNFTVNGAEENYASLLQIERKGYCPIPVIHDYYGKEIDFYISTGKYDMLALGSIIDPSTGKFMRQKKDIKYAVDKIRKHDLKIHIFASATYNMLHDLPVYSSDASSWVKHAAMGRILWWNPEKESDDKTEIIRMRDYANMKDDSLYFF